MLFRQLGMKTFRITCSDRGSEDPETAAFLSGEEKEAIIADLPSQAPSMESKTFDLGQIKAMFKNPTFVPFLVIWITHGIGGFGITFVLPTVIYELGISDTAISQLMTMVSMTEHARLHADSWY